MVRSFLHLKFFFFFSVSRFMQAVAFNGKEHTRQLSPFLIQNRKGIGHGFSSFDVRETHLLPNTSDDFNVSCCSNIL